MCNVIRYWIFGFEDKFINNIKDGKLEFNEYWYKYDMFFVFFIDFDGFMNNEVFK